MPSCAQGSICFFAFLSFLSIRHRQGRIDLGVGGGGVKCFSYFYAACVFDHVSAAAVILGLLPHKPLATRLSATLYNWPDAKLQGPISVSQFTWGLFRDCLSSAREEQKRLHNSLCMLCLVPHLLTWLFYIVAVKEVFKDDYRLATFPFSLWEKREKKNKWSDSVFTLVCFGFFLCSIYCLRQSH